MTIPDYLKPGDTVAIIATARKINQEELQPAIALLQSYGLSVLLGPHVFATHHQFAGNTEQRSSDLQWALDHPTAKAIIVARGGYGTVKLMEHVNLAGFKTHPKWLVGYSDVTVLHSAIHNLGIASLHATMPINFLKHEEATKTLIDALFGKVEKYVTEPNPLNKIGNASAELVGGNLSLLYALSGTVFDIDTEGKILFLEDLDEYLYHIDRMMMQLKLSGKLKKLKGLIIGGMSDMKDNTVPFGQTAEEIIYDTVKEYNYPVCFNFPSGHIDRNLALYFGKTSYLHVSEEAVHLSF